MHARVVLGVGKGVLFRERCPQFRSDLIERDFPLLLHAHRISDTIRPNFGHHQLGCIFSQWIHVVPGQMGK